MNNKTLPHPATKLFHIIFLIFIFISVQVPNTLAANKTTETRSYVALGDSFSSGYGVEPYENKNECKRSDFAYPKIVASELKMNLSFNACSGASTKDFLSKQSTNQAAQLDQLNQGTKLVTLTIGGNDIGFSSIAAQLIYNLPGASDNVGSVDDKIRALNGEISLPGIISYDNLFKKIKNLAPNATIIAIGYPQPYSEIANCGDRLSISNKKWINDTVNKLNNIIKSNALKNNIQFVNPNFDKHELCSQKSDWIYSPFILNTNIVQPSALHPTQAGQKAIAETIIKTLKNIEQKNDQENTIKNQFTKIYKRNYITDSIYDKNAVAIMTDGLKSAKRSFLKEIESIKTYISVYRQLPTTAFDWKIIQAIAYSGAKR